MRINLKKSKYFRYRIEGQRSLFATPLETNEFDRWLIASVIESLGDGSKQTIIQVRDDTDESMGKHAYFQSTPLGRQPIMDALKAKSVLTDAFMNFPSLVRTKFSEDQRSATLNKNDNVSVSELFSYEVKVGDNTWTVTGFSAVTQDEHALAGQLDHMILQNRSTGDAHTLRMGVGHLRMLDTPGQSTADLFNEILGGLAWCAGDRYGLALIDGASTSSKAAVEDLDRSSGMKLAKLSFTVGGSFSRGVLQPVSRLMFRKTAESYAIAYLLLVMMIVYYGANAQGTGDDSDKEGSLD